MKGPLARILRGYFEIGKRVGFLFLLVAGSASLGFAIAWPLWYFATSNRRLYSFGVLGALAAAGIAAAIRAAVRARHGAFRGLLAIVWTVLLLAGLYIAALLAVKGIWIAAIPVSLLWMLFLGWVGFGKGSRGKPMV